jgi:osmotically-inducible protein OsmY
MASVVDRECGVTTSQHAVVPRQSERDRRQQRVAARIKHSPYLEVRRVACHFHEGILFLRGRVSSYCLKQIAPTLVLGMEGVEGVNNQLEVVDSLPLAGKRDALPAGPF